MPTATKTSDAKELPLEQRFWHGLASALDPFASASEVYPLASAGMDWQAWLDRFCPAATSSPFAAHHVRAWEWFEGLEQGTEPPALIECWPRGHGKSTTVELAIVRQAVKATRRFVLYVCRTQDAANYHVQSIASVMERIGVDRAVNKYGLARGWSSNLLRTANGFNVLAFGLDAGARGIKLDEVRPDLIILDDVDDLEDSADATEKKYRVITQTVLPTGSTDAAVAFVQNLIHANSVMSRVISGEADMLRKRTQAQVVVAVEGLDYKRTEGEAGRTLYQVTKGTPTWSGKTLETCENEINKFGLISFLRECQQDVGVGGRFFPRFEPSKHGRDWHVCKPFAIPSHWDVWGSHDYGTGAPCSGHVYAADEYGDVYVIAEMYQAGLESSEQAMKTLEMHERLGMANPLDKQARHNRWYTRINLIAFDHANTFPPANKDEGIGEYPVEVWWRMGLPCVRGVKDRKAGWRTYKEWLAATRYADGEEKPRLQIFEGECPQLVKALTTAMTDPHDPEELDPGFKNDHALDDSRYGLMTRPSPSDPVPNDEPLTWLEQRRREKAKQVPPGGFA